MADVLKEKVVKFLRRRMLSKLKKTAKGPVGQIELNDEQEDEIAEDAKMMVNSLLEFYRLLPLSYQLAELGRSLEEQGKITLQDNEAYDEAAARFFIEMYQVRDRLSGTLQ